ncbi:MAG TPA: PIN domain-containing protein [Candidatus Dormibacteraeota bacterium]|nr:PIN domain-containing protein [Candidatus Dormibacteraeota bacterium]
MLVCDTSGLVAYFDASDDHNAQASRIIEGDPGPFVVSPYVVAELDFLLAKRRGVAAELAALVELSGGAWELPSIAAGELHEACGVMGMHRDQNIGLADASMVVLARRYRMERILTLDQRHFRVMRTAAGGPFTVLPDVE